MALSQPASAKPIISGLAYGTVANYVTPHYESPDVMIAALTALPAGSPPTDTADAQEVWAAKDDGSHEQVTVLLTADRNDAISSQPLSGLSFSGFVEKGSDAENGMGPLAPTPPSGQGELLASTKPITATTLGSGPEYYLLIDDSCTSALNGDMDQAGVPFIFAVGSTEPMSSFALFATAPGSHSVSVVAWSDDVAPTCS